MMCSNGSVRQVGQSVGANLAESHESFVGLSWHKEIEALQTAKAVLSILAIHILLFRSLCSNESHSRWLMHLYLGGMKVDGEVA